MPRPTRLAHGGALWDDYLESVFDDIYNFVPGSTSITRARARQSTTGQTLPTGASTQITFDVADFDSDGLFDNANDRFVIAQSGTYIVAAEVEFSLNTTGDRQILIQRNGAPGTGVCLAHTLERAASTFQQGLVASTGPVQLVAGDTISLYGFHNAGVSLTTTTDASLGPWFGIHRIDQASYSAGVASGLIGATSYGPASTSTYAVTTASFTDLDATNLKVTFTAPASGRVLVRLHALGNTAGGVANRELSWNLRDANGDIAGTNRPMLYMDSTTMVQSRVSTDIIVSGLTAGQVYTWKWGAASTGPSTGTVNTYAGTATGPAVMEVYDATIGVPNASFPQNGITQPLLAIAAPSSGSWVTSSTTTPVDVTGVSVTFTAPASGRVLVTVEGDTYNANVPGQAVFYIRDASNTVIASNAAATAGDASSQSAWTRATLRFLITSLVAGTSYTYKLGIANDSGASTAGVYSGSAVMTVQDAVLSPNMTQQSPNPFLLGKTDWNPTSQTSHTTTSVQPTYVDIDATNLAVTFIAPASGSVIIRAAILVTINAANIAAYLALNEGGTTLAGTAQNVAGNPGTGGGRVHGEWSITGLVPGSQHTYKLAWAVASASTMTLYVGGGNSSPTGEAMMEVWDGTAGQGSVQTPPGLTTQARTKAHLTAAVAIATGATVQLTGWTVDDDPTGRFSANSFTAPVAGSYLVNLIVNYDASTTGDRLVFIYVNGVSTAASAAQAVSVAGHGSIVEVNRVLRLNAGDVLTFYAYQSSGASINASAGAVPYQTAIDIQQLPDTSAAPSATSSSQVVGSRLHQQTTGTSVPTSTWTTLSWDTLDYDKGGFFASSSPTRLTVPTGAGGTYRVTAQASFDVTTNPSTIQVRVMKNGATQVIRGQSWAAGTQGDMTLTSGTIDLNAGDYLEVQANTTFAGTQTTSVGGPFCVFEAIRENSIALTDPTTTKGDLLVRSASGISRLPIGADGQSPVADSTQALGVKWVAVVTKIAETTLGTAAASIDFTSIPATYSHLRAVVRGRSTGTGGAIAVNLRYNGDTAANYDDQRDAAQNTTVSGDGLLAQTVARAGYLPGSTAPTNAAGAIIIDIPGYSSTTFNKVAVAVAGYIASLTVASSNSADHWMTNWRSTAAINQVTLLSATGNFSAGTTVTLYGM